MSDASALAQRLAKTHNLDLSTLSGSGANGVVTARDVLEHLNQSADLNTDLQAIDLDVAERASETPVQKAEAEPIIEPTSARTPQTEQEMVRTAKAEKEEPQSARTDSETPRAPRWMFWRR